MKVQAILFAAVVCLLPIAVNADDTFLTGNALRNAVSGKTVCGKWWISGDQLCQRWTSWMDGKSYCYKLTLKGKSVRWMRNDGRSGSGRIG